MGEGMKMYEGEEEGRKMVERMGEGVVRKGWERGGKERRRVEGEGNRGIKRKKGKRGYWGDRLLTRLVIILTCLI